MLNKLIDVFAAAVVGGMLGLIAHCWIVLIREVIR